MLCSEDPPGVDQSSSTEEAGLGLVLQSHQSHPGVLVDLGVLTSNHADSFLHSTLSSWIGGANNFVEFSHKTYMCFPRPPKLPWSHCRLQSNRYGRWRSSCFLSWWRDLACWIRNISDHWFQHSRTDIGMQPPNQNSRRWVWSSDLRRPPGSKSDNHW